jgi:hypothetical protein
MITCLPNRNLHTQESFTDTPLSAPKTLKKKKKIFGVI